MAKVTGVGVPVVELRTQMRKKALLRLQQNRTLQGIRLSLLLVIMMMMAHSQDVSLQSTKSPNNRRILPNDNTVDIQRSEVGSGFRNVNPVSVALVQQMH